MPAGLQRQHAHWQVRDTNFSELERGLALAAAMMAAGDEPALVERQLLAIGVSPAAAQQAALSAGAA
jgi:DNA-binding ferritin-like protein